MSIKRNRLIICALFFTFTTQLWAGKVNGLSDILKKNPHHNYYRIVLNGTIYDKVKVHPDFADGEIITEFLYSLRKKGITTDATILKCLEQGYQKTFDSILPNKTLNASLHGVLAII